MATPQHQVDPYQAQSRKSNAALVAGLIMLALLAGFAMGKGGLFGRSGEVAGGGQVANLDVAGKSNPVPIQAGSSSPDFPAQLGYDPVQPDLSQGYQPQTQNIQVGDKMPPEVRAWLLHLEKTEAERHRLTKAQLGSVLAMMTGMSGGAVSDLTAEAFGEESTGQTSDPSKKQKVEGETKAKRQTWRDLNAFFNSKQPPAECVPIKNAYEQCLGETSAMMLDILAQLEKSESDPQAAVNSLVNMMGTSAGKIDVAAKQSDGLLGQICHKYEAYKWFSVSGDIGGGLGGFGGGLGDLSGLLGGG